jgi:hypothetical protein
MLEKLLNSSPARRYPWNVHKLWFDFFLQPQRRPITICPLAHFSDLFQGWMVQTNVGEYLCNTRGDTQKQSMLIAPPFGRGARTRDHLEVLTSFVIVL